MPGLAAYDGSILRTIAGGFLPVPAAGAEATVPVEGLRGDVAACPAGGAADVAGAAVTTARGELGATTGFVAGAAAATGRPEPGSDDAAVVGAALLPAETAAPRGTVGAAPASPPLAALPAIGAGWPGIGPTGLVATGFSPGVTCLATADPFCILAGEVAPCWT